MSENISLKMGAKFAVSLNMGKNVSLIFVKKISNQGI